MPPDLRDLFDPCQAPIGVYHESDLAELAGTTRSTINRIRCEDEKRGRSGSNAAARLCSTGKEIGECSATWGGGRRNVYDPSLSVINVLSLTHVIEMGSSHNRAGRLPRCAGACRMRFVERESRNSHNDFEAAGSSSQRCQ